MHNQFDPRNTTMCRVLMIAAAVFIFGAPARAQSPQTLPPDGPTLKGDYVITDTLMCVPGKGGDFNLLSGLVTFDPKSGKLHLDGNSAGGDPVTLNHVHQTLPYTNSASTVTFGDTVYQATYGTVEKGIATYIALVAGADPCGAQVVLSRK